MSNYKLWWTMLYTILLLIAVCIVIPAHADTYEERMQQQNAEFDKMAEYKMPHYEDPYKTEYNVDTQNYETHIDVGY